MEWDAPKEHGVWSRAIGPRPPGAPDNRKAAGLRLYTLGFLSIVYALDGFDRQLLSLMLPQIKADLHIESSAYSEASKAPGELADLVALGRFQFLVGAGSDLLAPTAFRTSMLLTSSVPLLAGVILIAFTWQMPAGQGDSPNFKKG